MNWVTFSLGRDGTDNLPFVIPLGLWGGVVVPVTEVLPVSGWDCERLPPKSGLYLTDHEGNIITDHLGNPILVTTGEEWACESYAASLWDAEFVNAGTWDDERTSGIHYLIDHEGNYIVDHEGNRIIVGGEVSWSVESILSSSWAGESLGAVAWDNERTSGVRYLVDHEGNYIVDHEGNKIIVGGEVEWACESMLSDSWSVESLPTPGDQYLVDHEGNYIADHEGNKIIVGQAGFWSDESTLSSIWTAE